MRRKRVYDNGIFYRVPYGIDNMAAAWYNLMGVSNMISIETLDQLRHDLGLKKLMLDYDIDALWWVATSLDIHGNWIRRVGETDVDTLGALLRSLKEIKKGAPTLLSKIDEIPPDIEKPVKKGKLQKALDREQEKRGSVEEWRE